jgi:hypothetical protein
MNDEERKIILSRFFGQHHNESGEYRQIPISPVNRWLTYALLIPIVAVLALIGVFFFAAFLALIAVAVAVVGIRFWWLRRKLQHAGQPAYDPHRKTDIDQKIIIEDAQIIEETETHRNSQKKP